MKVVCPHCNSVFNYKIRNHRKSKEIQCPNCKGLFSKPEIRYPKLLSDNGIEDNTTDIEVKEEKKSSFISKLLHR